MFVQVFSDSCVISYWIDTLVLKLSEILISTLLHHPFLFKGKTNASSRSSRKNLWRCCQGDLCQFKTYQVPIKNSHLLHQIIRHSPLIFLSPTSKMIFEFFFPFLCPSSVCLSRLLFVCSCCIACFVTMAQENTKLCDFSYTNNNDFISTPIAPPLVWNLVKLMPLC